MEAEKLRKYILIAVLCMLLQMAFAETISIGDGNILHQGLPIEPVARFSYSQQLFLSSELGAGGIISQLSFHYNVSSNLFLPGNNQLRLWLGHSSRSTMPAWMPIDSLQLVFDGMLTQDDFSAGLPGNGWMNITLATPFNYDGLANLVLAVDENSSDYGSTSDDFICTNTGSQFSIQFQSATINPDPATPPQSGFSLKTHRSNIRIEIAAVHYYPVQPNPPNNASQVAIDTDISWVSACDSFDLLLGTDPDNLIMLAQNINACQWQSQSPLQYNAQYYWRVIGHLGDSTYPSPLWSFDTTGEDISPPRNLSAVYNSPVVQLSWQPPLIGMVHYYCIYRNDSPLINTVDLAYEDANLQFGQTYFYYVSAFTPSGTESMPSNLVGVTIPSVPDAILLQSFEEPDAFSPLIPGWQNLDLDNSLTWSWDNADFPHEGQAFGWLSFAPTATIPPLTNIYPYSGSQMAMAMSALNPPNNDWLISPPLHLGESSTLSFAARSATGAYGLERFRLLISTTTNDPASFTPLSAGAYCEVPADWTEYSYDLGSYAGQRIYLAWQCVSFDAFALFLDEIVLASPGGWVNAEDHLVPTSGILCYPNPSTGYFELRNPAKTPMNIQLFDLKGRRLFAADKLTSFHSGMLSSQLASGIYFLRISQNGTTQVLKQVILH